LTNLLFIQDQVYKRTELHQLYGGSGWGGIAVSAKQPYIFIFSLQSGHQHGYKDQWENEDVFSYTGEGQTGDMKFARGNLALRDHLKSKRRIFLFSEVKKAFVKFEAELELLLTTFFKVRIERAMTAQQLNFSSKELGNSYPI